MTRIPLAGVVLDCDGTIANTEPLAHRAAATVLDRHGYAPTDEDLDHVKGGAWPRTYAYWKDKAPAVPDAPVLRREIREVFRGLFDRELEIFDDAVETIRDLAEAGVPTGVASSSSHEHVERVLERAGVRDLIGAVVGADDCETHKPEPEPYLRGARLLDVDPKDCSAAEDTGIGVRAAKRAGMFVVGVLREGTPEGTLDEADRLTRRLTAMGLVPGPARRETGPPGTQLGASDHRRR